MPSDASVFYFAYGSNMSSAVFVHGFRKLRPTSAERAILHGYRLAFSEPGIAYFEPAFANIEKDERAMVEGVLYRITEKEMDDLHISEGGRAYNIIHISIEGSERGVVSAQTFQSKEVAHGLLPTKRYMDLLINGSEEHGLSEAWITMLKNTKYVDRTSVRHLRAVIIQVVRWMNRRGLPHPFRWWKRHHIRKTAKRSQK